MTIKKLNNWSLIIYQKSHHLPTPPRIQLLLTTKIPFTYLQIMVSKIKNFSKQIKKYWNSLVIIFSHRLKNGENQNEKIIICNIYN